MKTKVDIDIVTCPEWGAKNPKSPAVIAPKATEFIFHHTASHHAEVKNPKNESLEEAMRYARDIQSFHMGPSRGWNDSGHNFLICRNGVILQGRWFTVTAIQAGHMVVSAHCPGKNTQIGIEHEHVHGETLTTAQKESSAALMAWVCGQYERKTIMPVNPHSKYFATACPDDLIDEIAGVKKFAQEILNHSRG